MTVATESNFVVFLGDAVAVTFPFTFPVYDEDHLLVYKRNNTTKVLTLVSDADYSVTGVGSETGGSVVFLVAPAATVSVVLARQVPLTQDLSVSNQGGFYPENFEAELDLIEMQLQQHEETLSHTVRGQLTETWPTLLPAPDRRGKLLGFVDDATAYPTTDTLDLFIDQLLNILAAGTGISITHVGDTLVITNTEPADDGGVTTPQEWALNFTDDADVYIPVDVATTIDQGNAPIGTGTIAYLKSTSGAPSTFNATTLPVTLQAGAWLKVSATGVSGYKAIHLIADGGVGGSGNAEFVRDTIFAALVGAGCTITQDDPGDTITITVTGAVDLEGVYDAIAAAATAGDGIIVTNSDVGNTTTIAVNPEYIRDAMATAIVGGVGIESVVDDAGDTITLNIVDDIQTVVSAATVTPTFLNTAVHVTAQAAGLTIANPTGTAVDGHGILIRIKDNGTARALTWGAKFRAFNDALPTTTVISKTTYVGVIYNLTDDKWDVLGVRQEP
jgi:hypothetical protein